MYYFIALVLQLYNIIFYCNKMFRYIIIQAKLLVGVFREIETMSGIYRAGKKTLSNCKLQAPV